MFKVGDKVRRIGGSWLGMRRGDIGTVTFASTNAVKLEEFCETTQYSTHAASMLELVEPAKTPRKHAEVIKAWADGAKIQTRPHPAANWIDCGDHALAWDEAYEYRVKPTPKPDVVVHEFYSLGNGGSGNFCLRDRVEGTKCAFTFDGETGKLKAVELIK